MKPKTWEKGKKAFIFNHEFIEKWKYFHAILWAFLGQIKYDNHETWDFGMWREANGVANNQMKEILTDFLQLTIANINIFTLIF